MLEQNSLTNNSKSFPQFLHFTFIIIPIKKKEHEFNHFPPFFEGLLPEGMQLEALIRQTKTDRNDFYSLLLITGKDLVGSVTIEEAE